jgi:hypothetical protein
LKALAIREKKIHIVGSPEMKIEGTPVYMDVEGLPDRVATSVEKRALRFLRTSLAWFPSGFP